MPSAYARFIARPALAATAMVGAVALFWLSGEEGAYPHAVDLRLGGDGGVWAMLAFAISSGLVLGKDELRRWWQGPANQPHRPSQEQEDSAFLEPANAKALESPGQRVAEDRESRTRYLATASHELRQPLQAMKIFVDALDKTALTEEQRRLLCRVEESRISLGHLINNMLHLSKMDAGSIRPNAVSIGVHGLFGQLAAELEPLFGQKDLAFRMFVPSGGLTIRTDRELLLVILRNILGNAAKYTERGGVLLAARVRGRHLAIQVWDTGVGIAADNLLHIYTEFFRVPEAQGCHTEGFGLGLSIARRIAQLLDCTLECRSRPGRGTMFEVRIPLADGGESVQWSAAKSTRGAHSRLEAKAA